MGSHKTREASRRISSLQVSVRWATVIVGVLGVVLGTWGYRSFPDPLPWPNALYGGLQLIALGSVDPPDGSLAPAMLVAGRFLAAAALASAGVLVAIRFSLASRDRLSARRARGHLVVVGGGAIAHRLALQSARDGDWPRVVAVSAPDDGVSQELREAGVRVVPLRVRCLAEAVRGAGEIVIADASDVEAVAAARLVQNELAKSASCSDPSGAGGSAARVLLLLHSSELALAMGSTEKSIEVVGLTKAFAREFVWRAGTASVDAVVVAGGGEFAREVALAAVSRQALTGHPLVLHLVPDGSELTWARQVEARVRSALEQQSLRVFIHETNDAIDGLIRELVSRDTTAWILLVGPDAPPALAAAELLRSQCQLATIVAMVGEVGAVPPASSASTGAEVVYCTMADLVLGDEVIKASLAERLRRLAAFYTLGRPALSNALQTDTKGRNLQIERVARVLLAVLPTKGLTLREATGRRTPPVEVVSPALLAIQNALRAEFDTTLSAAALSPFVADLPKLLFSLGYELSERSDDVRGS